MMIFNQSYTINNKQQKLITTSTTNQKIKYHCQHNVDDIDERGVIEVPVDNDTVIYQDEDGQYYEVPVSDLVDYDGEDGEITYHSKKQRNIPTKLHTKVQNKSALSAITTRKNIQFMLFQRTFPRAY